MFLDRQTTDWPGNNITRESGKETTMLSNSCEISYASQISVGENVVSSAIKTAELALSKSRPRIRGGLPPQALRRVREYVETHLDESISVDALARVAGLSMYHFARAFKQSEGLTPHDYLVRCRVRHAQNLLASTDLPLSEIALAAGFSDQSHCARRFRERVGISPSSYRWSMR
jgi:transcriptional regulator GlxA family with amidase domain